VAGRDLGESTRLAAGAGAWICFEDEAAQTLRPPEARTWARRGLTPVIGVSGRASRLSVAGMACLKAGQPGRFSCSVRSHASQAAGSRRSMSEADYADLITAAHQTLDAPLIVIWDNLITHRSKAMRAFTSAHPDWLTIIQLPAYAPDLNAAEGAWAVMKSGLGNLAAGTLDQLEAAVRGRLTYIQSKPGLINGLLGQTGLTLKPPSPQTPAFQPL
jgi:hypothetical protein